MGLSRWRCVQFGSQYLNVHSLGTKHYGTGRENVIKETQIGAVGLKSTCLNQGWVRRRH